MSLAELVAERAGQRCEYCRMHQELQGAVFHVEHIVPRSLGGSDDLDNLAWACPGCNLTKANRVTITDPLTGQLVRCFIHVWTAGPSISAGKATNWLD